ncbi:MAG: hypothetical protein OEZ01_11450, partial [Candidatus Heimdallarchaeota archaeon]|nr:hypothetical protein [Candidatus Heimdallarchaeota archaeon]
MKLPSIITCRLEDLPYLIPIVFIIYSFILLPVWLVATSPIQAGISLMLFVTSVMVNLRISIYFSEQNESKIRFNPFQKITIPYRNYLVSSVFLTLIYFFKYLTHPLISGGDEGPNVDNLVVYMYLYTANFMNSILGRIVAISLIVLIWIGINRLFRSSIVRKYLLDNIIWLKLTLSLIFFSFWIGYTIYTYLYSIGLIQPALPQIFIRHGPIKGFSSLIIIMIFGVKDYVLRMVSIIFTGLILWTCFNILMDILIEDLDYEPDKHSTILIHLGMSFSLLTTPVIRDYCPLVLETAGEILFFILSLRFLLQYIRVKNISTLYWYSLSTSVGVLYRKSMAFYAFISFLILIIIHRKLLLQIVKSIMKSGANQLDSIYSEIIVMWMLSIPMMLSSMWLYVHFFSPYPEMKRGVDLTRVSFNFNASFTIFDYTIILFNFGGKILPILALIFIGVMMKRNSGYLAIFIISSFWYFMFSIEASWYVRVARFMAPLFVIIIILGFAMLLFPSKLINNLFKNSNYRRYIMVVCNLSLILTVSTVSYYQVVDLKTDFELEETLYPWDQLSEYLQTNHQYANIYSPWNTANPFLFYSFQYQLTQGITRSRVAWASAENQTINNLISFMRDNGYDLLVLPQANS